MIEIIRSIGKAIGAELQQEAKEIKRELFRQEHLSPLNTTISEWEKVGKPSRNQ